MRHPPQHPGATPTLLRRVALTTLLALPAALFAGLAEAAGPAPAEPTQRIMVLGDSQAQGLAGGVQRLFRADRTRRVLDRSKISTGLIPRPNYDWPAQARILAAERPDIAIALFGANDRPPVRMGGRVDPNLVARFSDTYGSRVEEIAEAFRKTGTPLVWIGHPIVRDAVYAEDMALLNRLYAERAPAAGATFIPTWDTFKGPDGGFSLYGKGIDGQTTRLRLDDGVHMTPAGYDVITEMLAPHLERTRPHPPA